MMIFSMWNDFITNCTNLYGNSYYIRVIRLNPKGCRLTGGLAVWKEADQ